MNKYKKPLIINLILVIILLTTVACYEPAKIIVINELENKKIEYIFVSNKTEDHWGTNALPDWQILLPGEKHEITVIPGTYDIHIIDNRSNTYTLWDIEMAEADYIWNVTEEYIDD